MSEVTFEMYMKAVNRILTDRVMLSSQDLPDIAYYDMYNDGVTPAEAAQEALIEAGAPDELINSIVVS